VTYLPLVQLRKILHVIGYIDMSTTSDNVKSCKERHCISHARHRNAANQKTLVLLNTNSLQLASKFSVVASEPAFLLAG
jgi:hypothetical protein